MPARPGGEAHEQDQGGRERDLCVLASRRPRRRDLIAENVGDFLDAEKEGAKTVQDVLAPPQHTSDRTMTPRVDISPVPAPHVDAGDTLTGITVLALLGAEAVRAAARHWRALERT